MKVLVVGIGAAGNKAVMAAIKNEVKVEDTIMVNSTEKDFPAAYQGKKIIISPNKDGGCGKEIKVAEKYALTAIEAGKFNYEKINEYTSILIATSVEGGTGSGSTPLIAKFFNKVYRKNVHIFAFTGFEEDPRGMANSISFFQNIDPALIVHCISNKSFLAEANNNKFKAEALANEEFCRRIRLITGSDFINSDQNIDETDILKVSNTSGYMTEEKAYIETPLVDQDAFNKLIKKMIYGSHSIKSSGAVRIGVILNIKEESEDAIDYNFTAIKETYGNPYENFLQKQWDEKKEYVAFIISGMSMPLAEVEAIYNRYLESDKKVNRNPDDFFAKTKEMQVDDGKFNMIRPSSNGMSVDEFLSSIETK